MFTAKEIDKMVEENSQEALDCLVEILQTPSPTGHETEVCRVFKKWIERFGIEVKVLGPTPEHPNILAEWFGSKAGKRFIFNGHMDTFPPTDGDGGYFGPYSGKIDGGYVYGRGACDMKGGDSAALVSTGFLKRMGFDPEGSILLNYCCDEQNGSTHGAKWLCKQKLLDGDYGIDPEATAGRIRVGHAGVLRMYITYTAEAAHSGRHHPKMDALEKSMIAINKLYEYRNKVMHSRNHDSYGHPSMSITTAHAGTATNVHATRSTFSIDRRVIPGETHKEVQAEILGILDSLKGSKIDMNYDMELISDRPFLDVPEDSPIVQVMKEAFEEITGRKTELYRVVGGTDAATLMAHSNIHMPCWSGSLRAQDDPGFGLATPNERVSVKNYLEMIKYFMLTLVKLMEPGNGIPCRRKN